MDQDKCGRKLGRNFVSLMIQTNVVGSWEEMSCLILDDQGKYVELGKNNSWGVRAWLGLRYMVKGVRVTF
jgi:hypothetical protein